MFDLDDLGPDTFEGRGPTTPWGALYGGQIVAQSLAAAARTVEDRFTPHSVRAYFIRRGDDAEPIRFEVDRIRDGRSFVTRRVVACQSVGAILNLEASFQHDETSVDSQPLVAPAVPSPGELANTSWSPLFDRRLVPMAQLPTDGREGAGRTISWVRATESVEPGSDPLGALLHRCWAAYFSDDTPIDAVLRVLDGSENVLDSMERYDGASLDHTIWFHRPFRIDEWHLVDMACVRFAGNRGLSIGYVYTPDGTHVLTCAQESLVRERRPRPAAAPAGSEPS